MKFDKPIMIVGVSVLISIVLFVFYSGMLGMKNDYYAQITESAYTINKDSHQYIYSLNGFDEHGKEKSLTFSVDKPYKKGTLVVVTRTKAGYTGDVHVVKENQLPSTVQKKLVINNF
ncbi:YxeA family protein (plasmid) [Priestia megaterium]|uniref:YxeA family protein n=1 Tax=Priestia megaterium TaxID=1404 RepID=UPI0038A571B4